MASSGKKKTTMAKLSRESKLRERRLDKQARKDARKNAPPEPVDGIHGTMNVMAAEAMGIEPEPQPVAQVGADD